jgi:hypothetical protein
MSVEPAVQRIRHVFNRPADGVVGLVDGLLVIACEHALRLNARPDNLHVQLIDSPKDAIDFPVRVSVVRAALARIAMLCNQRVPDSFSPYGGQGEVLVDGEPPVSLRAAFCNTAAEQSLELGRVSSVTMSGMNSGPSVVIAPKPV